MEKGKMEHQQLSVKLGFDFFPDEHTCKGDDTSPKVNVNGLSQPFMALILDDPDAPENPFNHWVVWNIPPVEAIPRNVGKVDRPPELDGAVQGTGTGLQVGYQGPCPPRGKEHRYFIRVYGLDSALDLDPGATREELDRAMQGHVKQYGETMARFKR